MERCLGICCAIVSKGGGEFLFCNPIEGHLFYLLEHASSRIKAKCLRLVATLSEHPMEENAFEFLVDQRVISFVLDYLSSTNVEDLVLAVCIAKGILLTAKRYGRDTWCFFRKEQIEYLREFVLENIEQPGIDVDISIFEEIADILDTGPS